MTEETTPQPTTDLAKIDNEEAAKAVEATLQGDLSKLTTPERNTFLINMAKALGLNPLSRPVDLIKTEDGRLMPYFNKGATDQLRGIHKVNVEVLERGFIEPDIYMVKVRATLPSGRVDESMATVYMKGKVGDNRANQFMKCETKAKRRVTLSALGLNFLDELEVATIPAFQNQQQSGPRKLDPGPTIAVAKEIVDESTGEVIEEAQTILVDYPSVTTPPLTMPPMTNAAPKRHLPAVPPVAVKK